MTVYICICNAITDKQVRAAAENGASNLWHLQNELGLGSNCGSCKHAAMEILRERQVALPVTQKSPG